MAPGRLRVLVGSLPAFLLLLSTGCGTGARLVPVTGKVTVEGKPLPAGRVIFYPDAEQGNTAKVEPRGVVDESGVYSLTTGDRPGAPPGAYKVAIFAMKQPTPQEPQTPPEWLANQRYNNEATSGLRVQVQEKAGEGTYDFDLKP